MIIEKEDTDILKKQVGERIRYLREKKGWSITRLRTESGISTPYLIQLEQGRGNPSIVYLNRIAGALSVRVSDITEEKVNPIETEMNVNTTGIPDMKGSGNAFFWAVLCKRAAAVQRAYQFDLNLSFSDPYRKLDELDWAFEWLDNLDSAAMHALDAIRRENQIWQSRKYIDQDTLNDIVIIWNEAIEEIIDELREYKSKNTQPPRHLQLALLALNWNLGNILYFPNNYQYKKAKEKFRETLSLISNKNIINDNKINPEDEVGLITTLAWACYYHGDYANALEHFSDAIKRWETIDSPLITYSGLAVSHRGIGATFQRLLRIHEAESEFIESLDYAKKVKDTRNGNILQLIWSEFRIGSFYRFIGDLQKGEKHLTNSDGLWKQYTATEEADNGLNTLRTMILNNLADLLIRKGNDLAYAKKLLEESIELGKTIHDKRSQAYSNWFMSLLYINDYKNQKRLGQALCYLDRSNRSFQDMDVVRYQYAILITRARVYCNLGANPAAYDLLDNDDVNQAIAQGKIQDKSLQILINLARAYVYSQDKNWKDAKKLYVNNIPLLQDLKYDQAQGRMDFARMLIETEDFDEARQQLEESRRLCEQYGYNALLQILKTTQKAIQ